MEVKALFKINKDYVIGDDRNIYRLPFTSNKKRYQTRKLNISNGRYYIGGGYVKREDIKFYKIDPYIIIKGDQDLPF